MRSFRRRFLLIAALVAVGIQFRRPERSNPVSDPARTLHAQGQVPPEVEAVLLRSCGDCHSNQTRWPWYSRVAPASWFLADHVNHGRQHLNFSEWAAPTVHGRPSSQSSRLKEICEQVEKGKMPLDSYLWIHRQARLSPQDAQTICSWTRTERARLDASVARVQAK